MSRSGPLALGCVALLAACGEKPKPLTARNHVELGVAAWVKVGKAKSKSGGSDLVARGLKLLSEDSTGELDVAPLFEAASTLKAGSKRGVRQGSLFAGHS